MRMMLYCAKCKKPVDRLERDYNFLRRATVFRAYCHGETETVELGDKVLREAASIGFGVAFGSQPIMIAPSPSMPPHTLVLGGVISVNVGGQTPAWVLELIKTEAGRLVFLGWVRGLPEVLS
jgi:hypothetical protein